MVMVGGVVVWFSNTRRVVTRVVVVVLHMVRFVVVIGVVIVFPWFDRGLNAEFHENERKMKIKPLTYELYIYDPTRLFCILFISAPNK